MKAKYYFLLVLCALTLKTVLFFLFKANEFSFVPGGNDSHYYDAYATGQVDVATSLWPVLLRYLDGFGLYSRYGVSVFLATLDLFLIPYLVATLSQVDAYPRRKRVFWGLALIVSVYPTPFFLSLDMYRDVFMVFTFVLGTALVHRYINTRGLQRALASLSVLGLAAVLFSLRAYLGLSFIAAFLLFGLFSLRKLSFKTLIVYLLALNLLFASGLLDPIINYREAFQEFDAGSNIGIVFENPALFLPNFVLSTVFQLFGLYFTNASTLLVFIMESAPFTLGLLYLIRNRKYADKFVNFLLLFSIIYGTIWLIGNDNVGTAVRLRMPNYIAVLISCAIVAQRKQIAKLSRG